MLDGNSKSLLSKIQTHSVMLLGTAGAEAYVSDLRSTLGRLASLLGLCMWVQRV